MQIAAAFNKRVQYFLEKLGHDRVDISKYYFFEVPVGHTREDEMAIMENHFTGGKFMDFAGESGKNGNYGSSYTNDSGNTTTTVTYDPASNGAKVSVKWSF